MNRTALPRLVAAAILLIAVVVAIIELGRNTDAVRSAQPTSAAEYPLSAELQRCQSIGEAALDDASCLDVWDENRRRFLTPGAPPQASE